MESLLYSLEKTLKEKLHFEQRTGVIFNSNRKPLYCLNENNTIKFVGNWLNRKLRWNYILKAYSVLDENSTYKYAPEQIRNYLNYEFIESPLFNKDVFSAMAELNEAFSQIDKISDFSLIIGIPGNPISLHILHPEATFDLSWNVTELEWIFQAGKLNRNWTYGSNPKNIELTRTFKREELPSKISQMIQDYINIKSIKRTFGTSEDFKDRYPLLSDYFLKKLNLSSVEYEKFAMYVEDKIFISPLDFELELANSRKKNKIKSTMFSSYRIGGEEPVYLYKKELTNEYTSNEIYFKLR